MLLGTLHWGEGVVAGGRQLDLVWSADRFNRWSSVWSLLNKNLPTTCSSSQVSILVLYFFGKRMRPLPQIDHITPKCALHGAQAHTYCNHMYNRRLHGCERAKLKPAAWCTILRQLKFWDHCYGSRLYKPPTSSNRRGLKNDVSIMPFRCNVANLNIYLTTGWEHIMLTLAWQVEHSASEWKVECLAEGRPYCSYLECSALR